MAGGERPGLLLLEPYASGSHRDWAHGLAANTRWDVRLEGMTGEFWKWRMHGSAVSLAGRIGRPHPPPAAILASDMLDAAVFLGLTRSWSAHIPAVLYAHETQVDYPAASPGADWTPSRRRRSERDDREYALINLRSMLAVDEVWWNSAYHRDAFLGSMGPFLKAFPDYRWGGSLERVGASSRVVPVGIDAAGLEAARPVERRPGPPRILWNHRWEHDKGPERLAEVIRRLDGLDVPFRLVLLGERFGRVPREMESMLESLHHRMDHVGHAADRTAYGRLLWDSDVVLSTARHDYFGVAIAEAMACGCLPLLPRGLAYAERLPLGRAADLLYEDLDDLVARMVRFLPEIDSRPRQVQDEACKAAADALDWRRVARIYDEGFDRLVAGKARSP